MAGAKPILIGGDFTPTWHIPRCPCDSCIEVAKQLDAFSKWWRSRGCPLPERTKEAKRRLGR